MSGNGNEAEESRERDEKGWFLPGNQVGLGYGRPKGSKVDFMTVCRAKAKEAGLELEDMVWAVGKAMFKAAMEGDAACAKIILDRACGAVEKMPAVAVQINQQNTVHIGAETRSTLKALMDRSDIQDIMLDELERRTDPKKG